MKLSFVDRHNLLTRESRVYAERRLWFAMSRFEPRIIDVKLQVEDENGLRGGLDKACSLHIRMRGLPDIHVQCVDGHVEAGVAAVAERGRRAVARAIDRQKHVRS